MITYKYKSKAKCIPGVQCLQCNDLETTTAEQELYVVTTAKTRSIRYIGMSRQYWLGRPTKSHNDTYNKYLNKYPNGYIIFRFKCDNAQQLERAGLELVKNANV